ncbi:helix-turn-helix transcriptional regulator, partial [Leucobacter sp. M11]|uniref:helix-turn-helix transcriptional regulator n=1 Tax=Leucobacter sp. M11 TaxID=2993565 RepID=UPI002D7E40BD
FARAPLPRAVPAPYLLTTDVFERAELVSWPRHSHEEHELLWSERGVVTARAGGRVWTLYPGVGIWIPRRIAHEARSEAGVRVGTTLFAPEGWTPDWAGVTPVRVNLAVQRLLVHLARTGMEHGDRLRAQRVCISLLEPIPTGGISAPIPQDPRIAPIVAAVLGDRADGRSLEDWALALHLSPRTVTRAFSAEVGMGFAQWRRLVRMSEARGLLAAGVSVTEVGRRVGFGTTSAFVAAFRRETGRTPGAAAGDAAPERARERLSPEWDTGRPRRDGGAL